MAEDSRRLADEEPPVLFLPRNYTTLSAEEDVHGASQRRLEDLQFDVIAEGQASNFDLQWAKDVVGNAAIEAFCLAFLLSSAL